jgi:hypothetical protein
MIRAFARLDARDLGFRTDGVLTARVLLPIAGPDGVVALRRGQASAG